MKLNVFRTLWQDPGTLNAEGLEEPSEARYRTLLLTVAALIIPPLVLYAYSKVMFFGLVNPVALDLAQIGRNLANGRGFTTFILRPLALSHGGNPLGQPDMVNGPLFPFLLSLAFGVFKATDKVAAGVSGLFYLLTIPAVYKLGKRVFSPQVGLAAAGVLTFNAMFLEYAMSGMHITLFIFLTTCLMLALFNITSYGRDSDGSPGASLPKGKIVLAGVLTSLLYLTDPLFAWFIPVVLLYLISIGAPNRLKYSTYFLAPVLALTMPWMIRNFVLSGDPVFGLRGMELWMFTKGHYPGDTAYRYGLNDLAPGIGLFKAIVRKIMFGLGVVIDNFPEINASWILAFLLPSLLFRFTDASAHSLRRIMMWCFLAVLVGVLTFQVKMYMFVSIVPTMLIFAIAYLIHLMQQAQLRRSSVVTASVLMAVAAFYPLVSVMTLNDKEPDHPEINTAKELTGKTRPNEVILSDQPWVVAWHSQRPSIWVPAIDSRISDARKQFGVKWLFITGQVQGFSRDWRGVYSIMNQWQIAALSAPGRKAAAPNPLVLDTRLGQAPLLEALSGFQSVQQRPISINGQLSYPVAFIAQVPETETRVGMKPDTGKQLLP